MRTRSRGADRLIRLVARWVPEPRRDDFRRQWQADLAYRASRGTAGSDLRWALGAVRHAAEVRRLHGGVTSGLGVDVRQGLRSLARRPGLTAVAVGIFAIGIGTATAVWSIVDALLFRPYPFPEPETLVAVDMYNPVIGMDQVSVTWPDHVDYLTAGPLASGAVFRTLDLDLADDDEPPQRVTTVRHAPGFSETLRVDALLGRLLGPDDQASDAPAALVLSERVWRTRYGSDPDLVGRAIRLDGEPHTVVGVLADDHRWPLEADVWVALRMGGVVPEQENSRSNFSWQMIARTSPGTTPAAAMERLGQVTARSREGASERDGAWRPRVATLHRMAGGGLPALGAALLTSAVLSVLLIAAFNVAGLLLVRASDRAKDLSLRAALGAGGRRLFRQLMLESVLLAVLGGVVGTLLGHAALRVAATRFSEAVPRLEGVALHPGIIAMAFGITLLAAVVGGLAPAARAARTQVADVLRDGTGAASASRRHRRLQRALVVAELALGTVLLMGAGMVGGAFRAALDTDPGFDADGLLVFSTRLPATRYPESAELVGAYDRMVRTLEEAPGVESVSLSSALPLGVGGYRLRRAFLLDGEPEPPAGVETNAQWIEVDDTYFRTLDVSPSRGRVFSAEDDADAPPVILINEAMARALPADGPLVGRSLRSWRDENLARTIVGVVPTIRMNDTELQEVPMVMVPRAQSARRAMSFMVRTQGDPLALVPAVRERIAELDPDIALDGMSSLRSRHFERVAAVRFVTGLFVAFGVAALLLGTVGVYSLVSFTVSQQLREFGIRMAIGASRGAIRRRVLAEGATLAILGVTIGMVLGGLFTRGLGVVLDGVPWLDPVTWLTPAVLLGTTTLLAALVPAVRATRADPSSSLRAE